MSKAAIRLGHIQQRQLKKSYSGLLDCEKQFIKLHEAYEHALKAHEAFWKYEATFTDGKADQDKTDWERLARIEYASDKASERLDRFVKTHSLNDKAQDRILQKFMMLNIGSGGSF